MFVIGDNAFKDCSGLSNLDMPMKFLDDADRIFSGENNLDWSSVRANIEMVIYLMQWKMKILEMTDKIMGA